MYTTFDRDTPFSSQFCTFFSHKRLFIVYIFDFFLNKQESCGHITIYTSYIIMYWGFV